MLLPVLLPEPAAPARSWATKFGGEGATARQPPPPCHARSRRDGACAKADQPAWASESIARRIPCTICPSPSSGFSDQGGPGMDWSVAADRPTCTSGNRPPTTTGHSSCVRSSPSIPRPAPSLDRRIRLPAAPANPLRTPARPQQPLPRRQGPPRSIAACNTPLLMPQAGWSRSRCGERATGAATACGCTGRRATELSSPPTPLIQSRRRPPAMHRRLKVSAARGSGPCGLATPPSAAPCGRRPPARRLLPRPPDALRPLQTRPLHQQV